MPEAGPVALFDPELPTDRLLLWHDPPSGLRALLCIDDLTLGPAAGGIRTCRYATERHALEDVRALARAMTLKCALAGVHAGGAKTVVLEHPGLRREAAFEALGRRIEELGGLYLAAGDLGTSAADLAAVARGTRWVRTDEGALGDAVARGLLRCLRVVARRRGRTLDGLTVAIQGCGAIGRAVARTLAGDGASLVVADVDAARATTLARELDAVCVPANAILAAEVDVLCPCGPGGVLGEEEVRAMRAWGLCGGANNIVRDRVAARVLAERGVLHVPDVVSSAGAVLKGVAETRMGVRDLGPFFDALEATAEQILEEAAIEGVPADRVAARIAYERIDAAAARA